MWSSPCKRRFGATGETGTKRPSSLSILRSRDEAFCRPRAQLHPTRLIRLHNSQHGASPLLVRGAPATGVHAEPVVMSTGLERMGRFPVTGQKRDPVMTWPASRPRRPGELASSVAMLTALSMLGWLGASPLAAEPDRTVLPLAEPVREGSTILDARDATATAVLHGHCPRGCAQRAADPDRRSWLRWHERVRRARLDGQLRRDSRGTVWRSRISSPRRPALRPARPCCAAPAPLPGSTTRQSAARSPIGSAFAGPS